MCAEAEQALAEAQIALQHTNEQLKDVCRAVPELQGMLTQPMPGLPRETVAVKLQAALRERDALQQRATDGASVIQAATEHLAELQQERRLFAEGRRALVVAYAEHAACLSDPDGGQAAQQADAPRSVTAARSVATAAFASARARYAAQAAELHEQQTLLRAMQAKSQYVQRGFATQIAGAVQKSAVLQTSLEAEAAVLRSCAAHLEALDASWQALHAGLQGHEGRARRLAQRLRASARELAGGEVEQQGKGQQAEAEASNAADAAAPAELQAAVAAGAAALLAAGSAPSEPAGGPAVPFRGQVADRPSAGGPAASELAGVGGLAARGGLAAAGPGSYVPAAASSPSDLATGPPDPAVLMWWLHQQAGAAPNAGCVGRPVGLLPRRVVGWQKVVSPPAGQLPGLTSLRRSCALSSSLAGVGSPRPRRCRAWAAQLQTAVCRSRQPPIPVHRPEQRSGREQRHLQAPVPQPQHRPPRPLGLKAPPVRAPQPLLRTRLPRGRFEG